MMSSPFGRAGSAWGVPANYCGPIMSGKPASGNRQAQILAQRLAFVFRAEQAAPLQFGDELEHDVVDAAGIVAGHQAEAVAGLLLEPLLHDISDLLWRTAHQVMGLTFRK